LLLTKRSTNELLRIAEVASRLSLSTARVYDLIAEQRLSHVRISNSIRIAPEDLAAFVAQSKGNKDEPQN
jgi:excisionase family DNA binding protein